VWKLQLYYISPPFCTLFFGKGIDNIERFQISGNIGNDNITTGNGNDTINGGAGNDILNGGGGNDTISGNTEDDNILGDLGNDSLKGNEGNDILDGGEGNDSLEGGDGNDIITQGSGVNIVNGGNGIDTLVDGNFGSFTANASFGDTGTTYAPITLVDGTTISNIEYFTNLTTGGGNDTINYSLRNNNYIDTGSGDDTINAGLGGDVVDGGIGNDLLIIDYSNQVVFSGVLGSISSNGLGGFNGSYSVYIFPGYDSITFYNIERFQISGNIGNDNITTGNGNDTINGAGGDDTINAGGGADKIILTDAIKQYYDDLDTTTAGTSDYANIFGFETQDIIQLAGSPSLYRLNVVGDNTELYLDKPGGEPDELIGIIQGVTNLSLTSDNFVYVQPVNLSVSTSTGTEAGTTVITVTGTTLSPVLRNESVSLSISGTVTSADYTLSNNTITIPSGSNTGTVTFTVVNDTLIEPTETATLTISNPSSGLVLGSTTSRNITIINDDFPFVNLSVSSNAGTEAGTTVITLTATASSPVLSNQTVNLAVTGTGITTGDYTLSGSAINIPSGGTTGTRTFTIVNDTLVEGTETATIAISSISSGLLLDSTTSRTVTITDNDFPRVNLSVSSNTGTEAGTTVITVTATATDPVIGNQTVDLAITGTGITSGDYNLSNSTISILNGQSTGTATFTVVDDALVEGSETAILTLANPSSGLILGSTTLQNITLTDNDFAPPEDGNFDGIPDDQQNNVLSIKTANNGYVTFAAPPGQPSVNVQTTPNPAPANTPPNVDFSLGFFAFNLPQANPGDTTTITLFLPQGSTANSYWKYGPTPDNPSPHWYNFTFDPLTNTGATFQDINSDGQNEIILYFVDGQRGDDDLTANGEIIDPGAPALFLENNVTLAVNPTTTNENGSPNLIYTFTRTGDTTNSLTVNFNVSGTATFSNDYTRSGGNSFGATAGSITFLAGSSTATLTLNPTADNIVESHETIGLTLSSGTGYTIGTATTIVSTITNDDGDANNNELIGGSGNDSLSGLGGNDTITGNAGNDILNGGTGSDRLIGNMGNDTYIIDDLNDVIVENASEGTDTVQTSINFDLAGTNLENITLLGTDNLNATGNSLNNTLSGNSGNNLLQGLAGNDNIDGKAGNDTLVGGAGNDIYTIDAGDTIVENANDGTDTVRAGFSYILADTLENLTLLATGNIDGTGNSSNNSLTGNNGDNRLEGLAGKDNLNGGSGNDTLVGGIDNDNYSIDAGDTLIENANEGTDSVNAGFTYTLGNNLENLTLSGNATINGTGNTLNNILNGNSGDNLLIGLEGNDSLDGRAANDTLEGGFGDDSYTIDVGDVITENANAGIDTVKVGFASYTLTTNFENLTLTGTLAIDGTGNNSDNRLTGNNAANTLTGLDGNDTLLGGSGNDTLVGGNGNDVLTGGSELDRFVLNAPGTGLDLITDFRVVDDTLVISAAQFGGGLTIGAAIDSSQFRIGAGARTATTTDHRFIYNSTNGALFFDPDGTNAIAATEIATLSTRLALTHLDIFAIA